ncbi:mechanosensitive ion channel family protein [Echinicola marina]|uniref:mechanosensitive ion channel family protein n=1 Tax=Echinicola marina TaxID=2859768 RepID=UPI001CF63BE4|nr:mechanosensitive ion channel domain-containing protein [Echinicola marina]UCS95305.1 mechanosensitive ion channel family protein [Echinicola marina]
MSTEKTEIKEREKHKRLLFIFKLIAFILIKVFESPITNFLGLFFTNYMDPLRAVTFLLSSNIIISLGRIITVRFYLRRKEKDPFRSNFVLGINHIASILNVAALLISLLFLFGISPITFFTSITIVAAAIALLSKDYITNMINGLIIMFSDQLSLGDMIKIGDQQGRIRDVTLLNMVLINEDADIVMIPNSTILTSQVINYSKQHHKKLSFEFEMKINHSLEVNQIEARLKTAITAYNKVINMDSFTLKIMEIMKEAIKFKCQLMMTSTDKTKEKEIRRLINQTIIEIAREN